MATLKRCRSLFLHAKFYEEARRKLEFNLPESIEAEELHMAAQRNVSIRSVSLLEPGKGSVLQKGHTKA